LKLKEMEEDVVIVEFSNMLREDNCRFDGNRFYDFIKGGK